ncbi:helix-turn-helix domain-containing protein [Gandjariella thermophila]|uniref:Transcriptional regulator n=1 Tax=Gandjariella thermophila TaxID=1931992 RepID=A0A4D4JJC9_9PSEU|nr:helix-turn-helix transcriptional regulator [Gandjariella thermophila]GDY34013.1 transcriptional regulator [Gandjariella thermophila]
MGANHRSPRARALCAALREARIASGISQRELGRLLSITYTNISLWENGHRVPSIETVAMILAALRTSPDERQRILDLARNASERNWLTSGLAGVPQQLAGSTECERAASRITEWSPAIVPGLLQTPDYTRAIMTAGGRIAPDDVELRIMVRAGRREVITRVEPVEYLALIGENALYEPIGSPTARVHQLRHLADMAERPNIVVQIVPARIGWHPGLAGPFILYDFPDASPVVYFEHHSSGAFVPDAHNVSEYRKAIEWIREIARDPDESLALVNRAAEEVEAAT